MTAVTATTDPPPAATQPRRLWWWVPPVLTLVTVAGVWELRARATVECDLGINAGAAMLGGALVLPAAAVAMWAVLEPVRRLLPRPVALVVTLLLLWAAGFLLLDHLGAPTGYPSTSPTCGDNVPHWWPSWLPT